MSGGAVLLFYGLYYFFECVANVYFSLWVILQRYQELYHVASNGTMTEVWWTGKDVEWSGGGEMEVRGRVNKQDINGSKTAVMDAIIFLYVSLSSSTVHLHDSLGSRRACSCSEAGFGSQNGVYYRKSGFCCDFCEQKNSMQRIFIKTSFLFTDGSVSRKAVHNWVEKFCPTRSPCWDCVRSKCAAGGWVDSSWQEDNDGHSSNCTRVFSWFSIRNNVWSFEVSEGMRKVGAQRTEGSRKKWTEWVCPCSVSYGM
jgi:hypothetical protein